MSTFLVTVGRPSATSQIRSVLLPDGTARESDRVVQQRLGPDRELLCVTRSAASEPVESTPTDHLFLGTAFDHRTRSLILGPAGFNHYQQETDPTTDDAALRDGMFLHARWSADGLIVKRDFFGLHPALWTATPDLVMVSDSLLLLVRLRRALGLAISADDPTVTGRSVQNILAYQLASERTPVEDVSYLPVGATLRVGARADGRPKVTVDRVCVADLFVPPSDSYAELLLQAAHEVSAVVKTIVGIPGRPATLSLSGGLDSRVLLGVLVHDTALLRQTAVTTSTIGRRSDDRSVAESLGSHYGFPLNPPSDPVPLRPSEGPAAQWALGALGIYDYLYLRRSVPEPGVVALGGQGSEIMKGSLGWTSIDKLRIEGRRTPVRALRRMAREGLESIGIEPDHPLGVEWHNVGYRNPIHTGQPVPRAQPLHFRPLMQRSLALAARAPDNPVPMPRRKGPSIITDLLGLLAPELCSLPFAEGRKPMDPALVAERLDALGGPLTTSPDPYRVFGAPADVAVGAPSCFLDLVADLGALGTTAPEVIAATSQRAPDLVPRRFRKAYAHAVAAVDGYQRGEDQLRAGMAAAKVLNLELLR
jgi:hypothetical protein